MTDAQPETTDVQPHTAITVDSGEVDLIADLAAVRVGAYSVQPWRIIYRPSNAELRWETETFEHPTLGPMELPRAGYDSKADALDAILRFADQRITALCDEVDRLTLASTPSDTP
jgi:hypothetical protein